MLAELETRILTQIDNNVDDASQDERLFTWTFDISHC